MIESRKYPVSRVGQMTFPASIGKDRWGVVHGEDAISSTDLQDGVLLIPQGTEFKLLEIFYPETEITKRAALKAEQHSRGITETSQSGVIDIFTPYKISKFGQFTLPSSARNRWDMPHGQGGKTQVVDLTSAALILPTETDINETVPELVPVDVFKRIIWEQQREPHTSFLSAAYGDWREEQGRTFLNMALKGGEANGYPLTHAPTRVAKRMQAFVTADVLKAAAQKAENRIFRGK